MRDYLDAVWYWLSDGLWPLWARKLRATWVSTPDPVMYGLANLCIWAVLRKRETKLYRKAADQANWDLLADHLYLPFNWRVFKGPEAYFKWLAEQYN